MIDDRPSITLGHSQVDIVARWALKDAISTLECLFATVSHEDDLKTAAKTIDGLKVAYNYFGGEAEGDLI